ncbi:hypothetical protein DRE_06324 [Drechslerella stenobrocha 248]|uniref:Uncharacterized protein n=1 Tax=Drechslerella stenobrocha 248 TaxID=1043628 RepID=W7HPI8_9PEZI|nr:hypothetical protein DRE_06324 [Drechslerella stenobrocha 248]
MVMISLMAASRRALLAHADVAAVDHSDIASIARGLAAKQLTSSRSSMYCLDVLLQGAKIHIPQPAAKLEPPEGYRVLMENLRHEYEEKAYAAMVGSGGRTDDTVQSITKEVSDQISVILNILFSSIFTGLAIWFATSNLATYKHRQPLRVGASILVAVIVAIAEVVLYSSYMRKINDAKTQERSKPEVKTLLAESNGHLSHAVGQPT